jgi:predicted type IV restriction endonuclease
MTPLGDELDTVRNRIRRFGGRREINEQNTKATLVEPVLRSLGWNVEDLDEVQREYRLRSSDKPVDYALLILRTPRLFVEVKAFGHNLDDSKWANQIMGYAAVAGVKWVVLTDGNEYRIYNSHASVPIAEKLFRTVCISDDGDPSVEKTLSLLSKDRLGENEIDQHWNAFFVDQQVAAALKEMFDDEPDKSLITLLKKRIGLGRPDIRASLARAVLQVDFPLVEPTTKRSRRPRTRVRLPSKKADRRAKRMASDTVVVPAKKEGFKRVFLGEDRWYAIPMGVPARKRTKYIAAYQSAPISAVTHLAEVKEIRPYKNTGKYEVVFKGPCKKIRPVPVKESKNAPQGRLYVKRDELLEAEYLEDAL